MSQAIEQELGTDLSEFQHSYKRTMLWANVCGPDMDHDDDPLGFGSGPGEGHADRIIETLPEPLEAHMDADCVKFLEIPLVARMIRTAIDESEYSFAQAGHDFALTRNGHGAGFWDRDIGLPGNFLTKIAQGEGSMMIYVEDPENPETWTYEGG